MTRLALALAAGAIFPVALVAQTMTGTPPTDPATNTTSPEATDNATANTTDAMSNATDTTTNTAAPGDKPYKKKRPGGGAQPQL